MPLMGKKAQPTPQELYKAKKQKAEEEKDALLPPGLINHGNTCFMNSVLQGLIATPMLSDMVLFKLPDSYLPVSPRRSPQLTNGHGQGGQWEQNWEKGMPLGDIFIKLMGRAWGIQERRERMSLSPRDVLSKLGEKYDQYLDFRQQDAHELLRHLLDAMRMEEQDIIKKRQPRQLKKKRSRSGDTEVQDIAEEDRLTSFVDMVFGGQLASILVCEKCKKISCTYEDFNDLSLSIKAEDYARERKRDRLRSLAKKFRVRGLDFSAGSNPQPRSSSVPASPTRRDSEVEQSFQQILGDADQRRRSLDASDEAATLVNEHERLPEKPTHVGGMETPVFDSDASVQKGKGKQRAKDGKDEDEDGWVKLSRRISVGMGLKRGRRKGKSAEPSRERPVPECEEEQPEVQEEQMNSVSDVELLKSPDPSITIASPLPPPLPILKSPFLRRPTPSRANSSSRNVSASPSPAASPALKPVDAEHHLRRPSSPFSRSKSPRPPKPSKEESAYLRRLLADVPASSSGVATPFHAFDGGAAARHSGLVWPKFGGAQSVEECLRMFTSVEVLDGENRVGCRRCWKIQHGEYLPRGRKNSRASKFNNPIDKDLDEDDSSEDSSISSLSADERNIGKDIVTGEVDRPKSPGSPADSKDASTCAESPSSSTSLEASSLDLNEPIKDITNDSTTTTVVPSPDIETKVDPGPSVANSLPPPHSPPCPAMTVPSISMTRPESPPSTELSDLSSPQIGQSLIEEPRYPPGISTSPGPTVPPSPSFDSLKLPIARHMRNPAVHGNNGDSTSTSSDESDDELDTETSMTASVHSEISIRTSPAPEIKVAALPNGASQSSKDTPPKPPRKKEVVFRRAYKRYLIKSPPPVLVIHLKRFHQVGKSPLQLQFSSNFKKLDDAVSFPEYLDLSPFLMPKKEDYNIPKSAHGLGIIGVNEKDEKSEKRKADDERCMYRLYAVVEHIGNMLGGHYVAYTVLPEGSRLPSGEDSGDMSATNAPTLRTPRTTSFENSADPGATKVKGSGARRWCHISDTAVRLASLEEVLKAKAYICMYERV